MTRMLAAAATLALATSAAAQVTFYEGEGLRGRAFSVDGPVGNFERFGFNDRASSAVVDRGQWEVCEDARFSGRCTVLRPGQYPSLSAMGLNNRISSVRPAGAAVAHVAPPPPAERYDYYPRHGERLFTAQVTSVRAVVSQPAQRCWVEREHVVRDDPMRGANVPGAIIGGIVGGVLGHQIGNGRGNDVATALGAVGGAVVGANVNRGDGREVVAQDVRRCQHVAGPVRPDYWDVTYRFRGREHRAQLGFAPGATITVNRWGEPRA